MVDPEKVGLYIAHLRARNSYTQAQLADLVGVSHQAVSKWETGASIPDIDVLLKIAKVFDITLESLLDPTDESWESRPETLSFDAAKANGLAETTGPIPTGTVSFLFTDIEGSTSLWQQHPQIMKNAIRKHDDIVSDAIRKNQGYVFKTVGDAFCATFDLPNAALQAAIDAQIRLGREDWGATGELKVRMAIHTGSSDERNGDYFGPTVNRVARIEASGHGSQILLSAATVELVRDDLPDGISLRSLGSHRLRDLLRPENIYQVVATELTANFPGLKTLDSYPNNLPVYASSFVGRERDLDDIIQVAKSNRVVTLVGPGGIGKTRLSVHVAAELLEDHADGVWFIDFSSINNGDLIDSAIATTIGLRDVGTTHLRGAILSFLETRSALLLFDNCEHMIESAALTAYEIVVRCPNVSIIASSREPLSIEGESAYHVHPLSMPEPEGKIEIETLSQYESVRLFIDRSKGVNAEFTLNVENAAWIAEICNRLDGLPLALELAAARTHMFSPRQIAERLGGTLDFLTRGARTSADRHRTIRAAIAWSYNLLADNEKHIFRALAVFCDGWTLETAGRVCDVDRENIDLPQIMYSLAEKSLVKAEARDDETRFAFLQTIRDYAFEKLTEAGEERVYYCRLLDFAIEITKAFVPERESTNLQELDVEITNVVGALKWGLDIVDWDLKDSEQVWQGLTLSPKLHPYWSSRRRFYEGVHWLKKAREVTTETKPRPGSRGIYAHYIGLLNHGAREWTEARLFFEEAMPVLKQRVEEGLGTLIPYYNDFFSLAEVALRTEGVEKAVELHREGEAGFESIIDEFVPQNALGTASAYVVAGDYNRALDQTNATIERFNRECIPQNFTGPYPIVTLAHIGQIEAAREYGRNTLEVVAQRNREPVDWLISVDAHSADLQRQMALLCRRIADGKGAERYLSEAVSLYSSVDSPHAEISACLLKCAFSVHNGELPEALSQLQRGSKIATAHGQPDVATILRSQSIVLCTMGMYDEARICIQEIGSICQQNGDRWLQATTYLDNAFIQACGGDYALARIGCENATDIFKALGGKAPLAFALRQEAQIAVCMKLYEVALKRIEESINISAECGDSLGLLDAQLLQMKYGNRTLDCADTTIDGKWLSEKAEIEDKMWLICFLLTTSDMLAKKEKYELAADAAEQALTVSVECSLPFHRITAMEQIAALGVKLGQHEDAYRLLCFIDRYRETRNFRRHDGIVLETLHDFGTGLWPTLHYLPDIPVTSYTNSEHSALLSTIGLSGIDTNSNNGAENHMDDAISIAMSIVN